MVDLSDYIMRKRVDLMLWSVIFWGSTACESVLSRNKVYVKQYPQKAKITDRHRIKTNVGKWCVPYERAEDQGEFVFCEHRIPC